MPRYKAIRTKLVWEEVIVEADNESSAFIAALVAGYCEVDEDIRDTWVEEL